MDLYSILGVAKDATLEAIKKAYKAKAKETHPDLNKGKRDEFAQVQQAYLVLKNPEKRSQYDKTGTFKEDEASADNKPMQIILTLFDSVLTRDDLSPESDYVKIIEDALHISLAKINEEAAKYRLDISKYQRFQKKFRKKRKKGTTNDPNTNIFKAVLVTKEKNARSALVRTSDAREDIIKALEILSDYECVPLWFA